MSVAALILSSVIFVEAFFQLRLDRQTRAVIAISRDAFGALSDERLGDDEKEACARRASRLILKATSLIVLKLAAIAVVLYAIFLGVAWIHPSSAASLFAALTSPVVLVSVTAVSCGYAWVRNAILG
ncbi:MAG TPA: hypothetical protein VN706_00900 [Gemmatimonadaceae bacterium]|nr:hypothetical protein [Gemmatimonadaceae bacterium]